MAHNVTESTAFKERPVIINRMFPYTSSTRTKFNPSPSGERGNYILGVTYSFTPEQPIKQAHQIREFINPSISLKRPITVDLEIYPDGEVIATIPEAGIRTWGDDQISVLREINEGISDLYFELKETPNKKLGAEPKRWKAFLNSVVKQ